MDAENCEAGIRSERTNARRLNDWLTEYCRREAVQHVGKNHVRRFGPLRDGARLDAALRELADRGRARIVQDGRLLTIEVEPATDVPATVATLSIATADVATVATDGIATVDVATNATDGIATLGLATNDDATVDVATLGVATVATDGVATVATQPDLPASTDTEPIDREAWEERAAICEYDGLLPRPDAERLAWLEDDMRRCGQCRHLRGEVCTIAVPGGLVSANRGYRPMLDRLIRCAAYLPLTTEAGHGDRTSYRVAA